MGYSSVVRKWVEEREWDKVRNKLPKGYVWWKQGAKRESTKGRAIGGMIMGVREGMETREGEEGEKEGIMMRKVKMGGEWWRVVGVYVNKDLQRKLEELKEWMEGREAGVRVVIGGDFNARTGGEGGTCGRG